MPNLQIKLYRGYVCTGKTTEYIVSVQSKVSGIPMDGGTVVGDLGSGPNLTTHNVTWGKPYFLGMIILVFVNTENFR